MMQINIGKGNTAEAAHFLARIPEFAAASYPLEKYQSRLQPRPHLILVARVAEELVGCKVGYALDQECFYSWMGAVLPHWRQHGIARRLAEEQEAWARNQGYRFLRFKTRNHCRAMLHFALSRGFNIIGVEQKETPAENRIWLEKSLMASDK